MRSNRNYGGIGRHEESTETYQRLGDEQFKGYGSSQTHKESIPIRSNSSSSSSTKESPTLLNNGQMRNMQGIGNSSSRRSNKPQDSWFIGVIQDMIQYLYTSISALGGTPKLETSSMSVSWDPKIKEALDSFKKHVRTPYNKHDSEHENLLKRVWEVCRPRTQLKSRISSQWESIGFQGKDPATDCRSTGVFGLQMIVYFAETYPVHFRRMFKKCRTEKHAYPFSIAALNVTMMLFELLGFGMPNTQQNFSLLAKKNFVSLIFDSQDFYDDYPFKKLSDYLDFPVNIRKELKKRKSSSKKKKKISPESPTKEVKTGMLIDFGDDQSFLDVTPAPDQPSSPSSSHLSTSFSQNTLSDFDEDDDEDGPLKFNVAFEEIFVMSFFTLHRYWFEANASYFQFPKILEKTRKTVDRYLCEKIDDLSDVMKWNKRQRP